MRYKNINSIKDLFTGEVLTNYGLVPSILKTAILRLAIARKDHGHLS